MTLESPGPPLRTPRGQLGPAPASAQPARVLEDRAGHHTVAQV